MLLIPPESQMEVT